MQHPPAVFPPFTVYTRTSSGEYRPCRFYTFVVHNPKIEDINFLIELSKQKGVSRVIFGLKGECNQPPPTFKDISLEALKLYFPPHQVPGWEMPQELHVPYEGYIPFPELSGYIYFKNARKQDTVEALFPDPRRVRILPSTIGEGNSYEDVNNFYRKIVGPNEYWEYSDKRIIEGAIKVYCDV